VGAALSLAAAGSPLGAAHAAEAMMRPLEVLSTADGYFVSGGVGGQERAELKKSAHEYNVRLTFARAGGAFLSYVDVKLEGAPLGEAIELTTAGPVLLAKLPPGSYVLSAEIDGWSSVRQELKVGKARNDMVITFERPADTRASR
jgi:hypothetical protein